MAYVGNNQTSPIIQEDKPQNPPPYEDSGVKYQGYSKHKISNNSYILKVQDENSISIGLNSNLLGLPAGTYYINRGNVTKKLIINFVTVSYYLTTIRTYLNFLDYNGSNGIDFTIPQGNLSYSFEIVPKTFIGEYIQIFLANNIPANEFISIKLYGWYEDR